ncbi:MAG: PilC/PilY family type IV pilus protein [Brachymonas sp.]|nr:PilC/PilY family type IV pilus protein [Brachymonas sp.]
MFKKTVIHQAVSSVLAASMLLTGTQAFAAPLELADTPPGSGHKPPKPNVIISLDNSGSMRWDINECDTAEFLRTYHPEKYRVENGELYIHESRKQYWCLYENNSGGYAVGGNFSNVKVHRRAATQYKLGGNYFKAKPGEPRMNILKRSLRSAITSPAAVPEGSIRLAWLSMHKNHGETMDATSIVRGAANSMRTFEGEHRSNFLSYLDSLFGNAFTPSHRIMDRAFAYMSDPALSIDSPWAKEPGVQEKPYLGCRRAYHIFLTDGAWNAQWHHRPSDNLDDQPNSNVGGSGQAYDPNADWARVFKGSDSGNLADWAFKHWSVDLQPNIPNEIELLPEYKNAPDTEVIGGVTVPKFWNPKYNPATWQHMTNFTIGYGKSAYAWAAKPRFDQTWVTKPANVLADNYGGDFASLYQGSVSWPSLDIYGSKEANRQSDLWHMALNSRGKFYPVDSEARLTTAFTEIFKKIAADNAPGTTSTTASGTNNVYTDVGLYTSGFDSAKAWKGFVQSWTLKTDGTQVPSSGWKGKGGTQETTADKLDNLGPEDIKKRLILSFNDVTNRGVPFVWKDASGNLALSPAQREALSGGQPDSDPEGENRLNYLRGDRTQESNEKYRKRQSRQGDIVNSKVWYVGKPASGYGDASYLEFVRTARKKADDAMIYVGGNDGMLHGFSAKDGRERLAYVPKGVLPALRELTLPTYGHKFFVDGSPFAGDIKVGSKWRTMLVGTLGAGGRGYFVLDVTDPKNFTVENSDSVVVLDATQVPRDQSGQPDAAGVDADLGHIFSDPVPHETYSLRASQVVKMNNGRWAAVLGNGYNSANEKPVLYIQYLDGDKSVHKLAPTVVGDDALANGLSAPRVVDINGDDTPDVIYAGDLKGNLWKFDVTSDKASEWGVAFGGEPLFKACARNNAGEVIKPCKPQPITAAPTVRVSESGRGMMVAFGTGQNLSIADRSNTDKQAVYSVLDNTRYRFRGDEKKYLAVHPGKRASAGAAAVPAPQALPWDVDLVNQTVDTTEHVGQGVSTGTSFWKTGNKTLDWSNEASKGWFMNLPVAGERVLQAMGFYDGSNILVVNSLVPASGSGDLEDETCSATPNAGKRFLTLVNILTGKPPSVQLMDLNGDGLYNAEDLGVARMSLLPDSSTIVKGERGAVVTSSGAGKALPQENRLAPLPIQAVRPSWRQLQ